MSSSTRTAQPVLPDRIRDVEHLEDVLSLPSPSLVEALSELGGDVLILGAAGKMGPTLGAMARRALDAAGSPGRVIAVSRFSSADGEAWFHRHGVETVRADLLDPAQLDALPSASNVIFMAGMKFGSTGNEPLTWAMNSLLPAMVARRYRGSRIVAFSTGNIYGLSPVARGGSCECDAPEPLGDYAMSCLGRERMFEHFSRADGTPVTLFRLNYATEMRYGVLVDIAHKVWCAEPVDVTMGVLNAVWQGDACAMALRSLSVASSPALALNCAGPEILSVRRIAEQVGEMMGKPVTFEGCEATTAGISNGQLGHRLFGYPVVPVQQMLLWIADWVSRGGASLGKPTHFEVRDGKF